MNAFWTSLIDTAGWTLVHFVWQGSLGAVVLAFALALVPRGCARVRYVLACLALAAMALLPAVTASYLMQHREDRQAWTLPGRDLGGAPAAHGKSPLTSSVASATAAPVLRVIAPSPPTKWFPWLVGLWMAGVCVCSVRLAGGWWHTRRFTVEDAFAADQAWVRAVEDLSLRLGLWTPVRLLESTRVQVPVVIGTLKPVLLLPASAMTGLSPQQIEAVLAHELAHIRRYDYLVNLVQSCVETVLFYHPGVWWVSHTIRVEREHCCDDLAVSVCGDPVLYARALTNIETLRHDAVGIAMAVSSGSLLSRVRRLLGVRPPARFAASGWAVLSLTAILVASAGLAGWVGGAMKALPAFTDAAEAATLRPDTDGAQASPATERATPAAKPRKAPPAAADVRPDHESDHAGDSDHQADDSRARPELEAAVREMEAA
jgi:beta-lactamase regulating signal transducer with metallopeptidase domain